MLKGIFTLEHIAYFARHYTRTLWIRNKETAFKVINYACRNFSTESKCPFLRWCKRGVDNLTLTVSSSGKFIESTKLKKEGTKVCPSKSAGDEEFEYEKFMSEKLAEKKEDGSYRAFNQVKRFSSIFPVAEVWSPTGYRSYVNVWCSNDYLGLSHNEKVKSAAEEALKRFGCGSGGTRNICGSNPLHAALESDLAKLHKKASALLFSSCYVANDTTLYSLGKLLPGCIVFSERGNHASMIQGIRNSRASKALFSHNDPNELIEKLSKYPLSTPKIVAFESVNSMNGSVADIGLICDIAHRYGALTFVDEVHAVGLYGRHGGGVGEEQDVLDKIDIISGTLGKAFGNVGGYIASTSIITDFIRSFGSGFIFTTSVPPTTAAGALAAIQISASDEGIMLREKLKKNVSLCKDALSEAGLPVITNQSHIIPVLVGDAKICQSICQDLLEHFDIYLQAINYPTVPYGTERLRIAPTPHHDSEMIIKLVSSLASLWLKYDLDFNRKGCFTCYHCKTVLQNDELKQAPHMLPCFTG